MESTFGNITAIRIEKVKSSVRPAESWIQIIISDKEGGHHLISCFPENGQTIPISLHPEGEDGD